MFYNNFIISLVVKLLEIVLGPKKNYIYIYIKFGIKKIIVTLDDYLQLCNGGTSDCGGGGRGEGGYGCSGYDRYLL